MNTTKPLYISKSSGRSLWQEYRVYPDRVEIPSRIFFKTFVIPADEILDIEVRPPIVIGDIFRGKSFKYAVALKLDLADLYQHVAIHRKFGWFKYLRFTPDNLKEFVVTCKSIMS